MGGAHSTLFEYFDLNGYTYHNMAHGRYTLPQYNVALHNYALQRKPKWLIYGLNEVSFALIPDYLQWKESGMDWFRFHSGSWCGPAIKTGFPHSLLQRWPRWHRLYNAMMDDMLRGAWNKSMSTSELVDKCEEYVLDAWHTAQQNDINFILLLIPTRNRMIVGPSATTKLFEKLIPRLKNQGVPMIDLEKNFRQVEDPATLYFQFDAHWNRTGVYRAAREILAYIEDHHTEQKR
jgi:hypothetical protein